MAESHLPGGFSHAHPVLGAHIWIARHVLLQRRGRRRLHVASCKRAALPRAVPRVQPLARARPPLGLLQRGLQPLEVIDGPARSLGELEEQSITTPRHLSEEESSVMISWSRRLSGGSNATVGKCSFYSISE